MTEEKEPNGKLPEEWRGTVLANALDIQKALAINELLVAPAPVLPIEEGQPVLPFEIGIVEQFVSRLKPDSPKVRLHRALEAYVHAKSYLLASAQPGATRHDIDAAACSAVNGEDRLNAIQRLKAFAGKSPASMSSYANVTGAADQGIG